LGATIKDVAKHSGLSVTTVSKFINGGNVLAENRAVLEKTIKRLGFEVNQVARGLKCNRSMMVGVIVPTFEGQFFMRMISNIENSLMRYGYSTIVCDCRQDLALEAEKIRLLYGKQVDGIILAPSPENAGTYRDVLGRGIAMVFVDTIVEGIACDAVVVDNRNAAQNAVSNLISRGHTRIGLISMDRTTRYTARERVAGYVAAHEAAGIPLHREYMREGPVSFDGGGAAMLRLLDEKPRVTACLVTNDEMTLGALNALHRGGLRIPQDISIIGFDLNEAARAFSPELSTVAQPLSQIGETAADILVRRMNKEKPSSEMLVQLKTELILRDSIRALS
jgi:LacI family transcriptional regulator